MTHRTLVAALASLAIACVPKAPTAAQSAELATEVAAKDAEDRECLRTASTCEGYVACRARVAVKYRVAFTGRCVP